MPLFAVICRDKPGQLQTRLDSRQAHLGFIRDSGIVRMAGPLIENGDMCGSLIVLEARDLDAARDWAAREGVDLGAVPFVAGWGHRTAPMLMEDKLVASRGQRWVFPELRRTLEDAWRRAGVAGPEAVDAFEVHDCFSITQYMVLDHLGLEGLVEGVAPGRPGAAIAETGADGRFPVNPSGGLIGGGHPVGATGVRMLHDAAQQVRGLADGVQVDGARRAQTLNLGGSSTTTVSFVVER